LSFCSYYCCLVLRSRVRSSSKAPPELKLASCELAEFRLELTWTSKDGRTLLTRIISIVTTAITLVYSQFWTQFTCSVNPDSEIFPSPYIVPHPPVNLQAAFNPPHKNQHVLPHPRPSPLLLRQPLLHSRLLHRRLEQNPHLQPTLATPRQVPQRPNNVARRAPRSRIDVLRFPTRLLQSHSQRSERQRIDCDLDRKHVLRGWHQRDFLSWHALV
jgi:hypothetical protein